MPEEKNKTPKGKPERVAEAILKQPETLAAEEIRERIGLTLEDLKWIDEKVETIIKSYESFDFLEKVDARLHKPLALRLIEENLGDRLLDNLRYFHGLDAEVAEKLIGISRGDDISIHISSFLPEDHKKIATSLIDAGHGYWVASHLDSFQGLDHNKIAMRLIESGDARALSNNLHKFHGLRQEVALGLIDKDEGYVYEIVRFLDHFQASGHNEIAQGLIDWGRGSLVVENFNKFPGLDHNEIALRMIDGGEGDYVVRHINKFHALDHNEIALKMIDRGEYDSVLVNFDNFKGLDSRKIALALINNGHGESLLKYLDRFHGLDHNEFGQKLIETGQAEILLDYITHFENLDPKKIFDTLSKKNPGLAIIERDDYNSYFRHVSDQESRIEKGLADYIGSLASDLSGTEAAKQAEAVLTNCKGVEERFGRAFYGLWKTLKNKPDLWANLVYPTIMSQKIGSFLCLEDFSWLLKKNDFADPKVPNLLRFITTQTGIKAHDILRNLIIDGLYGGEIHDLSAESSLIRDFIESKSIPLTEIYQGFKAAKEQGKPELYREIVEVTKALQEKIADGTCEADDFNNRFFPAIVMYTFPPAIGVERNQYANLIGSREDRQGDVPKSLEPFQGQTISVSSGGYKLKEGETLDTKAWNAILKSVEEGKKTEGKKLTDSEFAGIGKELCFAFSDGRLKSAQEKFLGILYRVYQSQGQSLPDSLSSHRELMAYKEYVGDSLNDLIGLLLQTWQKKDAEGFGAWQQSEIGKRSKDLKGLAKQVAGVLKNDKMDEAKKTEVLKKILERAEFQAEGDVTKSLTEELEKGNLEEFLKSKIETKGNTQKFNLLIKNALLGREYSQMYEEMQKYEFAEGVEKQEYQLFVSKKKEHGCAGLNMGVCVTPDEKLWNNPNFMNVITMKDKIAYGGMHFLIVETDSDLTEDYDEDFSRHYDHLPTALAKEFDDEYLGEDLISEPEERQTNKYLVLPGINPNEALLGQVAAAPLFDEMMDYAKRCAEAMGCEKVLIPKRTEIHSNRSAIQEAIASKNYPTFDFGEEIPFSYDPYRYSFQECYEVT